MNNNSVEIIQVIHTRLRSYGMGHPEHPERGTFRLIDQYWSMDGKLLAEADPMPDEPKW